MLRLTVAAAFLAATGWSAAAMTITGIAEVRDSDLILIDGYRVYLLGAESVEAGQPCIIGGRTWECYPAAVRQLQTIMSEGVATCEVVSGPNFLLEVIARCTVHGDDVSERFIRSGFAVTVTAETDAYAGALAAAQAAGVGFWQGTVVAPAEWRAANGILAGRPTFRPIAP